MKAILDFISKDVKQYMEQKNLDFTDFETAALIYNSWLPIPEKHERLEALAAETKDANLRKQIMEILSVEKEDIKAFHENTKGFVYMVLLDEENVNIDVPRGYFATQELAYAYGLKQTRAFSILKYKIVGQDGAEMQKSKSYWNPYLMTETMCMEEYDCDSLTAWLGYTQEGFLQEFWSRKMARNVEEYLAPFMNAFPLMLNPFEQGDIVRQIPDGCHGVVNFNFYQEERLEFLGNVNAEEFKVCDFADANMIVEFVYEQGYISHRFFGSFAPIFLEKYESQKDDDDFELLMAASDLLKGRGGLDWFLHQYNAYKEKCQQKMNREIRVKRQDREDES